MYPSNDRQESGMQPAEAPAGSGELEPAGASATLDEPETPGAAPVLPPVASRPRRFGRKRLLLALVLVVVLVSSIVVGRQVWINIHLPPLLSIKTFEVPFVPKHGFIENNPTGELRQIIAGPDGTLYFLPDFGNWIGRMTPDSQVSRILLPLPSSDDTDFVAWGGLSEGGGSIWASESWGNGLWRLDLATGALKNYERFLGDKDYLYHWWNGVVTADGSVWLEIVDNQGLFDDRIQAIGQLDPQTGTLKTYPVQPLYGGWGPMAQATDGSLWIITAQINGSGPATKSIGVRHFDPKTGAVTTFTIVPTFPTFESTAIPLQFPDVTYPPAVIATGGPVADSPMITPASDGGVWVLCEGHASDGFISYPVHISPTGKQKVYLAPDNGSVVALLPGSEKQLWVVYYDPTISPHYILGQLSSSTGFTPIGRFTDSQQPLYLTIGADQHFWMTTEWSNIIQEVELPH